MSKTAVPAHIVESACRRGTCPRCHGSFEVAIMVDGTPFCPRCCNVLIDDGTMIVEEVSEDA